MVKPAQLLWWKSQILFIPCQSLLRGKTHNDLLSKHGRKAGYTDIIFHPVKPLCHTSVLGSTFFRNVHPAYDLDPGHNGSQKLMLIPHHFLHNAVNAETDPDTGLHSFNMDITGPLIYCLFNDLINQHNNWCIINFLIFFFLMPAPCLLLFLTLLGKGVCHLGNLFVPVISFNTKMNIGRSRHHRFYDHIRHDTQVIHGENVQRIRHGHSQYIRVLRMNLEGQDIMFPDDLLREEPDDLRRQLRFPYMSNGQPHLAVKGFYNLALICKVQLDQRLSQPDTQLPLLFQRLPKLFVRDNAGIYQHIP